MDYLAYYRLALEIEYGGEFPPISPEEFNRRWMKTISLDRLAQFQKRSKMSGGGSMLTDARRIF